MFWVNLVSSGHQVQYETRTLASSIPDITIFLHLNRMKWFKLDSLYVQEP